MASGYMYYWQKELLKAFDPDNRIDNVGLYNKFRSTDQDEIMTQTSPISENQREEILDGLAVLHGLPNDLKKAALEGRASSKCTRYDFRCITKPHDQNCCFDADLLLQP